MRPGRSSPSATPCPRRSATGDAAARQGGRPLSKSSQDIKVALKAQRGGPPHRPVLAGRPPTSSQPTSPLDNPNLHRESKTRTSCRDQVILVDETAETVPAPNAGGDCFRIRPSPDLDSPGRPEREASVRPLIVVVPHVLVENALKMTPTPEQHPVQTLLPDRPHPALRERVGIRRLDRGLDNLDAVADEDIIEGPSELAIAVTNQEPRCDGALQRFHLYRAFPCPLDDPSSVRVVSDAGDPNLPRVQLDEEQDVEGLEANGLHGEEVGGDDAGGLGSKERSPGDRRPSGRGPKPIAEQHRADRGRCHADAELLELALDALVAPAGI